MKKSPQSTHAQQTRRNFLRSVGLAVAGGFVARHVAAADAPHLTLDDPTAQALGYTENSAAVDEAKYPTHKAGMECSNCNFFQGAAAAYGPCQLYSGKLVNAKGWCAGYAKKA